MVKVDTCCGMITEAGRERHACNSLQGPRNSQPTLCKLMSKQHVAQISGLALTMLMFVLLGEWRDGSEVESTDYSLQKS